MDTTASKKRPKKYIPLQKLTTRKNDDNSNAPLPGTVYRKRDEDSYVAAVVKNNSEKSGTDVSSPRNRPRAPPSAAGHLISDFARNSPTRKSSPSRDCKPESSSKISGKTKISISGGKPMHGASTTISEIDAVIRSLEISTNKKSKSREPSRRACNCNATKHPLLAAAPNCLSCGKIICVMEGLGPCTFCGMPPLSSADINSMITVLREEREREKTLTDNKSQKRSEMMSAPEKFTAPKDYGPKLMDGKNERMSAEFQAKAHRDKLLQFQAQNASRSVVRDEAADFITDDSEFRKEIIWATPVDRAIALKKQQKLLQEMEWNAKPEYERKKVVVSLDVVKGKVIKRYESSECKPEEKVSHVVDSATDFKIEGLTSGKKECQSLSENPLLGCLVRPIWTDNTDLKAAKRVENQNHDNHSTRAWRKVQDDQEDNEELILDGGLICT